MDTKKQKDEAVLKIIVDEIPEQLEKKFRDGMEKYQTALIDKDCLAEAMPEVLDLIVYLAAEKERKHKAAVAWETICTHIHSMALPKSTYRAFEIMRDYFSPKPLAQKIPAASPPEDSDYAAFCRFAERYAREGRTKA